MGFINQFITGKAPPCIMGKFRDKSGSFLDSEKPNWLVVGPPLWKIWVRQLGWLETQYFWENKIDGNQTTNQFGDAGCTSPPLRAVPLFVKIAGTPLPGWSDKGIHLYSPLVKKQGLSNVPMFHITQLLGIFHLQQILGDVQNPKKGHLPTPDKHGPS